MYYFLFQTGHLMCNNPVMIKIFLSTLRESAFIWFMQLLPGTIKPWSDIEREFLSHFIEDDNRVSVHSFLATKQKGEETVKGFIKRFREMLVWCLHGMSQETLILARRHNLQTKILVKMGAVELKSWKELIK